MQDRATERARMAWHVRKVKSGTCPACEHPLTDPAKSKVGWAWCRNPACRKPWVVKPSAVHGEVAFSPPQSLIDSTRRQVERGDR